MLQQIALCYIAELALSETCHDTVWESCDPDAHDARQNRRRQRIGLRARQHENRVRRGLLERLEQGIGGVGVGTLRNETLGVPHDEHLAVSQRGREVELAQQQADRGDPVAREARRRLVQGLLPARGHLFHEGVADELHLLVRVGSLAGDLDRDEPMNVRDRKSTRLNSSHANISYAVFCLKKKKNPTQRLPILSTK